MKKIFVMSTLLFSFYLPAQTLEPGLWKTSTSLDLNGIPLPDSDDEECITKDQTKDVKTTIEKGLKRKGCTLTKWMMKGEKLKASLNCKNNDVDAVGKLTGTVTKKSYDLHAEAQGKYKGTIPATAEIKLTGQWVKKCN